MGWRRDATRECPQCDTAKDVKTNGKVWKCFRCQAEFGNDGDSPDGKSDLEPISPVIVASMHRALLRDADAMRYLRKVRGLTDETVRSHQMGIERGRIVIPVPNAQGEWINLRGCKPGDKLHGLEGRGVQLYPMPVPPKADLYLMEGEWDALLARQMGYEAHTSTGGARTFKESWAKAIGESDPRSVTICYDEDTAGRVGSQHVAIMLAKYVPVHAIKVVHFPVEKPHKDFGDWILKLGHSDVDFDKLCRDTPLFWSRETKKPIDRTPIEVSLAGAGEAPMARKFTRFQAMVGGIALDPYLIPKTVRFNCTRDLEICSKCQLEHIYEMTGSGDVQAKVDTENDVFLRFLGRPREYIDTAIRKENGIPSKCDKVEVSWEEHVQVWDVRITDRFRVEADAEMTERTGVAVGVKLVPNHTYSVVARTLPHPDTQATTHVIHSATPIDAASKTHKFDPAIVKPLRSIRGKLERRVSAYLDDCSRITGIWERPELHLGPLLAFHSPEWIKWDAKFPQLERGWLDILIVGDTSQGKSKVTESLWEWTGLGERAALKRAVSRAGLLGGMVEHKGRRWISWGIYPKADKRLLICEEIQTVDPEILSSLTDARSSGQVEVNLAGQSAKTYARTRLICIGNPRNGRTMGSYAWGIQAAYDLWGSPEDLRRNDFVIIVTMSDIAGDLYQKERKEGPQLLTREMMRATVLRAWGAGPVTLNAKLRAACREGAVFLSGNYMSKIPLLSAADTRWKLARIGISLANMFAEEPGSEHVEYAVEWIHELYSRPSYGYFEMSQAYKKQEELRDPAAVVRAIAMECGDVISAMNLLLSRPVLYRHDFDDLCGGLPGETLRSALVMNNALIGLQRGWAKTEGFVDLLRQEIACRTMTAEKGKRL